MTDDHPTDDEIYRILLSSISYESCNTRTAIIDYDEYLKQLHDIRVLGLHDSDS